VIRNGESVRAISIVSVVVLYWLFYQPARSSSPCPATLDPSMHDDDEFDDVIMQMHASICLHRGIDPRSIRII
jgi:hypothetical protein